MMITAYLLSLFSLIVSASQFLRLRAPFGFYQILPGSISPILVLLGVLGAGLGAAISSVVVRALERRDSQSLSIVDC